MISAIPPMATTVVGSFPSKPTRESLAASYQDGSDPFLKSLEHSVKAQLEAGIDIVSDGQTRDTMVNLFAKRIRGIRMKERPFVIKDIEWSGPITVDDQIYARKLLPHGKTLKGIVTGPYTMAKGVQDDHYKDLEGLSRAFAGVLNSEARALEPQVDVIQFDEPFFSVDYPSYAAELVEIVREGLRKPVALHVCGDVAPIFSKLAEMKVDILDHEFAANPGLLGVVKDVDFPQKVGYGSVNSFNPAIEKVEVIEAHISKAVEALGTERLLVDPDCGLKHLDEAVARVKLGNMVKARDGVMRHG